jgi:hypothetical protein
MCSERLWIGGRERGVAEAKLDITDELLVAYVDDELNPAQREMVDSVLATSPALCRRAQEMRLSRDLLREAFPLHPDRALSAPIEAASDRLAEACVPRRSHPRVTSSRWSRWGYAMAAGLAVCAAAPITYLVWRVAIEPAAHPVTGLTQVDPDSPLHRLLESVPSADVINIPREDAALRAVLTFQSKDGRFCREFEILAGSGGSTGIACRHDGEWRSEVLLSASAAPALSNHYTPAGESDDTAVAEVVARLMEGDPLSAEEEAAVLARGWRAPQSR